MESETRVAEDVERLRSVAKFHAGTDLAPEDEAALTRVLDALETAQAEAREKDETIARLTGALEPFAGRQCACYEDIVCEWCRASRALAEQGDESNG